MLVRLLIVATLVVAVLAVVAVWRRRSAADAELGTVDASGSAWPAVPADVRADGRRTWVIFTTPTCASCATVERRLHESFPADEVRTVDATQRLDLADRYAIRRAPTTLLVDADGTVLDRFVGPDAVHRHVTAA